MGARYSLTTATTYEVVAADTADGIDNSTMYYYYGSTDATNSIMVNTYEPSAVA